MTIPADMIAEYFGWARERQSILLKRQAGQAKPWTEDDIIRQFRFTNVFREDDATTIWIKDNIREPLRADPFCPIAMIICRLFNRMSTLELLKPMLLEKRWDGEEAKELVKNCAPLITAAYLVASPKGMNKLDGLISMINAIVTPASLERTKRMLTKQESLRSVTEWVAGFPLLGEFIGYEVACDLQFTDFLMNAPDIMTWINPGPGCQRGLARMKYGNQDKAMSKAEMTNDVMFLLEESKKEENWPKDWPEWDARTAEGVCCEISKYLKTKDGIGTPKQMFDGGGPKTFKYGAFNQPSSPRAIKDPIQEAVNRKMIEKEIILEAKIAVLVEQYIKDTLEPYAEALASLPEDFLPISDRVNVSGLGRVMLSSMQRIPARFVEAPIFIPEEYSEEVDLLAQEREALENLRATMYEQIQAILA